MIPLATALKHYKRREIQEEIVEHAKDKEVASKFNDSFGTRPNSLNYPQDVFEEVKNGATSFHASEERWKNPLKLSTEMTRRELDEQRAGFDLVLDIDCAVLEYSTMAAELVVDALKHHEISSISAKFSGNKGFHIGVPFESLPKEYYFYGTGIKETRLLFPELPRNVAFYLREMIRRPLADKIMDLEKNEIQNVIEKTGKEFKEIVKKGKLDVESFLAIDTVLISSRHLYRMPYCFNEKSGLISIPLNPKKIMEFDKESAKPENVNITEFKFLDRIKVKSGNIKDLLDKAFKKSLEEGVAKTRTANTEKQFAIPETAIPEKFFPPCVKKILEGMEDGRKRSLFILINFLTSVGWSHEQVEARIREWNKNNREPLREVYLIGQLRYRKQQRKKILPPNCHNRIYYEDLRIKCPEEICSKVRNPVNYTLRRGKR